jgi:hypothetical protein
VCLTSLFACDLFCTLSRGLVYISNASPACSCVYICKFQFRPIHPPSRRLSDTPKGILPRVGTRLRAPLLIRGSKAGPPRGSTVASDRVGPTPTTGQRFEGRPPRRAPRPPQATRAPRPLLIRGSKAGPRRVHSRLRRRARDDQGYIRYITKARAALPRYPRTFPRPAGAIL